MLKCPGIFLSLKIELVTLNFNHYIEHYILPSLVGNHKVTSSKLQVQS